MSALVREALRFIIAEEYGRTPSDAALDLLHKKAAAQGMTDAAMVKAAGDLMQRCGTGERDHGK